MTCVEFVVLVGNTSSILKKIFQFLSLVLVVFLFCFFRAKLYVGARISSTTKNNLATEQQFPGNHFQHPNIVSTGVAHLFSPPEHKNLKFILKWFYLFSVLINLFCSVHIAQCQGQFSCLKTEHAIKYLQYFLKTCVLFCSESVLGKASLLSEL